LQISAKKLKFNIHQHFEICMKDKNYTSKIVFFEHLIKTIYLKLWNPTIKYKYFSSFFSEIMSMANGCNRYFLILVYVFYFTDYWSKVIFGKIVYTYKYIYWFILILIETIKVYKFIIKVCMYNNFFLYYNSIYYKKMSNKILKYALKDIICN